MTRCLELLRMDLFGPSSIQSYRVNHYTLVIVNDYSSDNISGVVVKSRDKVSHVVAKSGGDVVTYKASSGDV
nr:retrovirus-related Pol polyprotein from transposon TNT 1-94 [Tanacetum cinerariifolium]